MQIKYIDKEQDWVNETTRYWFNVDGDDYCIADQNGELTLLDCHGGAAMFSNRDYYIYNVLISEREKHIND